MVDERTVDSLTGDDVGKWVELIKPFQDERLAVAGVLVELIKPALTGPPQTIYLVLANPEILGGYSDMYWKPNTPCRVTERKTDGR